MKKYFGAATFILLFTVTLNAQQESGNRKAMPAGMQNCMNAIASDSTLRMQMMSKMMEETEGDTLGMMQMCKKMMSRPGMQKMMMNMMHSDGMGGRMQMKKEDHMMKPRE